MTKLISVITAPEEVLKSLELIQMQRGRRQVTMLHSPEPNQHDADQIYRVVTNGAGERLLPYLGDPMKATMGKYAKEPLWDDFLKAIQESRDHENESYGD